MLVRGSASRSRHRVTATRLAVAFASVLVVVAPTAAARREREGLLPPQNPDYSLAAGRYLPGACAGVRDYSSACMSESIGMINAGRRSEALGPLLLPSNWTRLSVARQLFVLTDLERTARGLDPEAGLVATWSQDAQAGAMAGRDPSGPPGAGALWAGGEPNAIIVIDDWIYEDGRFRDGFSENLDCTATIGWGCWMHRDILLQDGAARCDSHCAVGAGFSPVGYRGGGALIGHESYAELLGPDARAGSLTFSWDSELIRLPACERDGDSCSWAGSPIVAGDSVRIERKGA